MLAEGLVWATKAVFAELVSDAGTNFVSEQFKNFADAWI